MRWMSYNIKLGERCGAGTIAEIVRRAAPDVLALQEVGSNWRAGPGGHVPARLAYATGLPHRVFVPTIVESGAIRYGHALLSRWPIADVEIVALTRQTDEQRKVLVGRILGPGEPVQVVATHLSHIQPDRLRQGGELLEIIAERTSEELPTVLMGDLNEPAAAADGWLRDLFAQFDTARRIAPAPTFENPEPSQRIDYVMVRGGRWESAHVPAEPDASDHRPVVAEL